MNRKLDGCYFRVKRDDEWQSVCFSDLTDDEREVLFEAGERKPAVFWKTLAYHLADRLKEIGDELDIYYE